MWSARVELVLHHKKGMLWLITVLLEAYKKMYVVEVCPSVFIFVYYLLWKERGKHHDQFIWMQTILQK